MNCCVFPNSPALWLLFCGPRVSAWAFRRSLGPRDVLRWAPELLPRPRELGFCVSLGTAATSLCGDCPERCCTSVEGVSSARFAVALRNPTSYPH